MSTSSSDRAPVIERIAGAAFEPTMVVVPAGDFLMGCATGAASERPAHQVTLSGFALGETAITNRLYRHYLKATSRTVPGGWLDARFNDPDQPVTSVSWFDATDYCAWL